MRCPVISDDLRKLTPDISESLEKQGCLWSNSTVEIIDTLFNGFITDLTGIPMKTLTQDGVSDNPVI